MDCSPPGSSSHGIFQARVLECGAIAKDEEKAITNKAAKPYSFPLHYKHIGAHSHFCFELVCVHGITDSIDMSLSKLWEIVNDTEDWSTAAHGVTKT